MPASETTGRSDPAMPAYERDDCQLYWLESVLLPLNSIERAERFVARRLRGLRRRLGRVLGRGGAMTQGRPVDVRREPRTPRPAPGQRLEAGDFAEVLALDEIRATLDADRIHDGLKFLRPMEQHCGRTFRVMKRVRYVFDERERRMRKSRSVVLLDGVMCDGAGMYGREGCDRSCFFFWKEAWLRKVDPPSGGGSGT